jgi:hypothetical protein
MLFYAHLHLRSITGLFIITFFWKKEKNSSAAYQRLKGIE